MDSSGRLPALVVLDVNETLSDMAPMATRFEDVGAPGALARTWFAGVLRDGFALTAAGSSAPFAEIAGELLRSLFEALDLDRDPEEAVHHVMDGFANLPVHADVEPGLRAFRELGVRVVTLSNGSAGVAEGLLGRAGLADHVEAFLSVEDVGSWKPAAEAYGHALSRTGVAAEDAMLVAVHPWDVHGANRAGLSSGWVNRRSGRYPGHFSSPTVQAGSLVALADVLSR